MKNRIDISLDTGGGATLRIHQAEPTVRSFCDCVDAAGFREGFACISLDNPEVQSYIAVFIHSPETVRKFAADLTAAADELESGKLDGKALTLC